MDLHPDWHDEDGHLVRSWKLPDFAAALALVNRIGALADAQDHHPEVRLGWGHVRVELWSHDLGRVTDRDHRLAAAIDRL